MITHIEIDMADITKGVPQDSILRSILFTLYMNEVDQCVPKVKFTIYFDDTSIILLDEFEAFFFNEFHRLVTQLYDWFS